MKHFRTFLGRWVLPPGFKEAIQRYLFRKQSEIDAFKAILAKNTELHNFHAGQRCFILGTGPSISRMDLAPLSKEICIALNAFHHHPDYACLAPRYQCVSGLACHPTVDDASGEKYIRDIVNGSGNTTLLLHARDSKRIESQGYLSGRMVYYFLYDLPMPPERELDATHSFYCSQNVTMMAMQIALYMGFKYIYLLGLDHDWIFRYKERLYTHFYNSNSCPLEREGYTDWIETNWADQFYVHHTLWTQYRHIRKYAEEHGVEIVNLTTGGILDVFERSEMKNVLEMNNPDRANKTIM